ncbi:DUF1659 domain-containing protein [Marinilactibacillus piezotolerans]|uniref:DUF1659 domain-containing protein n=1 Tax=Marinilactibacillus piezotolerans TaxID=258723 RepID=UPI0009AF3142|nr:hypothetical protein [Marinilactibacillus piezotolerans]
MQKEWAESRVEVYFEDVANERLVRRSFNGALHSPTNEQITAFTQAIDTVSELPVSETVLVEEYRYSL